MGDCLADYGYLYRVPTNNVGILSNGVPSGQNFTRSPDFVGIAGNFGIWPIISQNPLLLNRLEWTPVDFL